MLTDFDVDQVARNHQRQQKENRGALCSYNEMAYWRRRARGWRALFFLLLVIVLLWVRK